MNVGRLWVIVVGTGVLCALVTGVAMSLGTDPPPWLLAGIAGLGGAFGGTWATKARKPAEEPPVFRQLVGARCVVCDKKVKVATDAHHCDDCGGALHNDCAQEHDHT